MQVVSAGEFETRCSNVKQFLLHQKSYGCFLWAPDPGYTKTGQTGLIDMALKKWLFCMN